MPIEPLSLSKVVKLFTDKVGKRFTVVHHQQRFSGSAFGKYHLVCFKLDVEVFDLFNTLGHRLHDRSAIDEINCWDEHTIDNSAWLGDRYKSL